MQFGCKMAGVAGSARRPILVAFFAKQRTMHSVPDSSCRSSRGHLFLPNVFSDSSLQADDAVRMSLPGGWLGLVVAANCPSCQLR